MTNTVKCPACGNEIDTSGGIFLECEFDDKGICETDGDSREEHEAGYEQARRRMVDSGSCEVCGFGQ